MSDQFLGEIRVFPSNKIPKGFLPCNGQILAVSQFTSLFALIGDIYGGNASTTFALPNLAGRAALMAGQGVGLTEYYLGEPGGESAITLTDKTIPKHTHNAVAKDVPTAKESIGNIWSTATGVRPAPNFYASKLGTALKMSEKAISYEGGNNAHNNLMPYVGLVFCIATEGYFPNRV